jgi:carboxypeptidase PM20D1
MGGFYKFIFKNVKLLKPLLIKIMPKMSTTANAMLKTTVAFTMAKASDGSNVLPQEAYVIANMRYSHHQGKEDSINAIKKLADKYNVETVVLDGGNPSSITDYNGKPFKFVEKAINKVYPNVKTSPYIMTGASDSRYMQSFSEHCIRFTPFYISNEQLDSIHAVNENLDLKCLAPAVDFYKYVLTEYDNGEN